MMNKTVLIVIGVLMIIMTIALGAALVYESIKGRLSAEKTKGIITQTTRMAHPPSKDYSVYKTTIGGDGEKMVLIPAGIFPLGSSEEGDFDEKPQRIIFLDAYYIDQYEVTNKNYKRFASMTGRRSLPEIPVFEDDITLLQGEEQPVVGATWLEAVAYCKWAGKRLPTEAEWEKAARGTEERTWPWGNVFDPLLVNGRGEEDGFKYSAPVGRFERGRSFYGLYDMAGNVSEWVSDWYDQFFYNVAPDRNPTGPDTSDITSVLVYRGGSYTSNAHDLRASKRFGGAHPKRGESTVGVRCARDIEEE